MKPEFVMIAKPDRIHNISYSNPGMIKFIYSTYKNYKFRYYKKYVFN